MNKNCNLKEDTSYENNMILSWVEWKSNICIEIKIKFFIFTLPYGASEGFMKVIKAFIKPFEAPQRSVKIEI